jgi:hypothetical protein
VDTAQVNVERFRLSAHRDDVELCTSLIVHEFEEDLCGGRAPETGDLAGMKWGIEYRLGP